MEESPYGFESITHFSIRDVEKYGPRFEEVRSVTLEIGSKIPAGRYPLVLIRPFPPLGRPGKQLDSLAHLRAEAIDSIWAFPKPADGRWARIEIPGKDPDATIFVDCERIEGVPSWGEKQQTDSNRASD